MRGDALWPHKLWAVKALAAQEKEVETVRYAEACRSLWARDLDIDGLYGRGSRFLCLRQVRVSVSIEVAAVNTFPTGPSGKDRALALQPTLELDPPPTVRPKHAARKGLFDTRMVASVEQA